MDNSFNGDYIKVVYATNDKHRNLVLVSMTSILQNTSCDVEFIILYSHLSEKTFEVLNSIKKFPNCRLVFRQVDETQFQGFKNVFWVTIETWFRVLIPETFTNYDKVIYLDCDTLVRGDISEFYNIDISNVLVAGVKDVWGIPQACARTGLDDGSYFNAGVLLINCKKWREQNLYRRIMDYANQNPECTFADQDVLNHIVFKDKILLSTKFNYLEGWWGNYHNEYTGDEAIDYENSKKNALIVHYTAYKPDTPLSRHSLKDDWWEVAKKTDYYLEMLEQFRIQTDEWLMRLHKEGKIKV